MKERMTINYTIACWSGMRRVNPKSYVGDRPVFLRKQLESLKTLKHSISQITIVVNENKEEPARYREFLKSLPSSIGGAEVVLMERPNVGYSYGAYSDVFQRFGTTFDYYMLMEDDYLFTRDDFDKEMVVNMETNPKRGFLSFALRDGTRSWIVGRAAQVPVHGPVIAKNVDRYSPDTFQYPLVCVGLMRSAAMADMWAKFGQLPYSKFLNHSACKFEGQFGISIAPQKCGWGIGDVIPKYRARAFGPGGEITDFGPKDKPLFLSAIQPLAG